MKYEYISPGKNIFQIFVNSKVENKKVLKDKKNTRKKKHSKICSNFMYSITLTTPKNTKFQAIDFS